MANTSMTKCDKLGSCCVQHSQIVKCHGNGLHVFRKLGLPTIVIFVNKHPLPMDPLIIYGSYLHWYMGVYSLAPI